MIVTDSFDPAGLGLHLCYSHEFPAVQSACDGDLNTAAAAVSRSNRGDQDVQHLAHHFQGKPVAFRTLGLMVQTARNGIIVIPLSRRA